MRHGKIGLPHHPKPRATVSPWTQVGDFVGWLVIFGSVIVVLIVGGAA